MTAATTTRRRDAVGSRPLPAVQIGNQSYAWAECVALHRTVEQDIAEWLLLSPDGDFVVVESFGAKGHHAIRRLAPEAARRYLVERGEGDVLDDFPALFAA